MSRLLVLSLAAGVIGAIVADRKGRNRIAWGVVCALFPVAVLLVVLLPPVYSRGITKQCPHCGEVVSRGAALCGRCGRQLPIEMLLCGNCGKYVPEGDSCPECNKPLR